MCWRGPGKRARGQREGDEATSEVLGRVPWSGRRGEPPRARAAGLRLPRLPLCASPLSRWIAPGCAVEEAEARRRPRQRRRRRRRRRQPSPPPTQPQQGTERHPQLINRGISRARRRGRSAGNPPRKQGFLQPTKQSLWRWCSSATSARRFSANSSTCTETPCRSTRT